MDPLVTEIKKKLQEAIDEEIANCVKTEKGAASGFLLGLLQAKIIVEIVETQALNKMAEEYNPE